MKSPSRFPLSVAESIEKYGIITDEAVYFDRIEGKLLKEKTRYRLIDLFAGAGGLTLGFTEKFGHIFQPIWANDFDEDAAATYNSNFGNHCTIGEITHFVKNKKLEIPEADVVIGGPPCQGFSLLNKKRKDDSRRALWRPFLEVVRASGAQVFVMENVPQLLGSDEHRDIIRAAKSAGFKITSAKLCAADYGVAQVRFRGFIIGCKFADPQTVFAPKKTHYNPKNGMSDWLFDKEYICRINPWRTVRDQIFELSEPEGTEITKAKAPMNLHFGRKPTPISVKRYKAIPKEGMNRFDLQRRAPELVPGCWIRKTSGGTDLFGRLWWDRPAFTIRTEFFKPEKGRYLHPSQHRPITHREAARLQSFPDSFRFIGSKIEIAKQIGNAVPPLLAARVADSVYALLKMRDDR